MGWTPRIVIICGCGQRRGLNHVCVTSKKITRPSRAAWAWPNCPDCKRPVKNPLTHICRSRKGDWGRRKKKHERQRAAAAKAAKTGRTTHDYETCADDECTLPYCRIWKRAAAQGYGQGYEAGWYARDRRGDTP